MIIESSDFDVLARFDEENIPFPPFVKAISIIDDLLTEFRQTGLAQHLIVLGESGTGKSSLCRLLLQKYPRIIYKERDVIPVLMISVPAAATVGSVASAILIALGDPDSITGTISNKTNRILTLSRNCKVELLLIDEAQHMHDRGRSSTHYMVGDWLKRLIDDLQIPTVFLGLPRLQRLIQLNDQLRRRFSRRVLLALGQSEEMTIQSECLQLFISLAACLPVRLDYGDFSLTELGQRLYYASDGRIAYIKKLLVSALRKALLVKSNSITPQDLEVAFTTDIWWEGVGKLNPFCSDFEFRRLDRAGEPFENGGAYGRSAR